MLFEELDHIRREVGDERYFAGRYLEAVGLLARMASARECPEFLTLPAYDYLD